VGGIKLLRERERERETEKERDPRKKKESLPQDKNTRQWVSTK
jgi:hypothetical protein